MPTPKTPPEQLQDAEFFEAKKARRGGGGGRGGGRGGGNGGRGGDAGLGYNGNGSAALPRRPSANELDEGAITDADIAALGGEHFWQDL